MLAGYGTQFSQWTGLEPGVITVMGGVLLGLAAGTVVRLTHLHRLTPEVGRSLLLRLRTWWIIAIVLALVVLLGRAAAVVLMGGVSLVALHEYLGLLPEPERSRVRGLFGWLVAATVLQYAFIWLGEYDLFIVFVPVVVFLGLTLRIVLTRDPAGFRHLVGTVQWGMMLLVFCLSHVAFLLTLPGETNPVGGPIGWFLFLVILTEFNDIAQALFGRPFGRHKIIPEVSPGKSWEGLAGAMVCTAILATVLAPRLTPLAEPAPALVGTTVGTWFVDLPVAPWPIILAVAISLAGFGGDIVISALKRDVHVKDSGTMLPGQGGILDRIDSLTFTAPLFFHAVRWLHGGAM
jgi:phosphatidate cytidylyltransferase